MPVRVFREEQREQIRESMLEAGFELLKEKGMTHMSVEKITSSAGIGKSTFYNFFTSKEDFVYQMIGEKRKKFLIQMNTVLAGREKMTETEAKELIKQILFSEDSVYPYLTQEDEVRLMKEFPQWTAPDLDHEKDIMDALFSKIEDVRENPDYAVISNLMKIIVMAAEGKAELHEAGYLRTQNELFELMFGCIFDNETYSK